MFGSPGSRWSRGQRAGPELPRPPIRRFPRSASMGYDRRRSARPGAQEEGAVRVQRAAGEVLRQPGRRVEPRGHAQPPPAAPQADRLLPLLPRPRARLARHRLGRTDRLRPARGLDLLHADRGDAERRFLRAPRLPDAARPAARLLPGPGRRARRGRVRPGRRRRAVARSSPSSCRSTPRASSRWSCWAWRPPRNSLAGRRRCPRATGAARRDRGRTAPTPCEIRSIRAPCAALPSGHCSRCGASGSERQIEPRPRDVLDRSGGTAPRLRCPSGRGSGSRTPRWRQPVASAGVPAGNGGLSARGDDCAVFQVRGAEDDPRDGGQGRPDHVHGHGLHRVPERRHSR